MSRLQAGERARRSVRWSLLAIVLLAMGACSRMEASDQVAPAATPAPAAQKLAANPAQAAPSLSLTPTAPGQDGLDAFEQALVRKLDRSQMSTRPASATGGILHIPNGHAAHAAILVRNPDGTLRRECISSTAEATALVQRMRGGAAE